MLILITLSVYSVFTFSSGLTCAQPGELGKPLESDVSLTLRQREGKKGRKEDKSQASSKKVLAMLTRSP